MKQIIYISLVAFFSLFHTENTNAQDKIISTNGKTIKCDITKITDDAIFFNLKVGDKSSNTYIIFNQVKQYFINELEKLKNEMDTSSYFSLKLDDGTGLTGKIRSINGSDVDFYDNSLGMITIKGETIKLYSKENKKANYHITLHGGNEVYGYIVERKKNELDFQTKSLGKVTIAVSDIKKMREIQGESIKGGQYWFPNPNNTRYLFSPTAIPIKKGEGYYQNAYIISNSANYGLTDNFSIGGGIILPTVVFLTPKFGFKVAEKFHLGGGAIVGFVTELSTVGILYGVATYGSDEHNITLGGGYGFYDEELVRNPIITFCGMTRVGKRVALVTENWFLPYQDDDYTHGAWTTKTEYYTLLSYGIRIMNEKITFDIALINNRDIIEIMPLGIPYIDFVYKF